MSLLGLAPFFPLYYNGKTKFTPIHATDLADIIFYVIDKEIPSQTIEAVGPEILTFKEMLSIIMESINKKKILVPLPLFFF